MGQNISENDRIVVNLVTDYASLQPVRLATRIPCAAFAETGYGKIVAIYRRRFGTRPDPAHRRGTPRGGDATINVIELQQAELG